MLAARRRGPDSPFRSHVSSRLRLAIACMGGLIAMATVPASAGPVEWGAGVVPSGVVNPCGKGSDNHRINFDFLGRMPAGNSAYQVLSGEASFRKTCLKFMPGGGWNGTMTGQTPSGTINWTCSGKLTQLYPEVDTEVDLSDIHSSLPAVRTGPGWLLDLTCRKANTRTTFRLLVVLASPTNDNRDCCNWYYPVVGAYVAQR